jgi:hypothetical protein
MPARHEEREEERCMVEKNLEEKDLNKTYFYSNEEAKKIMLDICCVL